jgi:hypothetical protein
MIALLRLSTHGQNVECCAKPCCNGTGEWAMRLHQAVLKIVVFLSDILIVSDVCLSHSMLIPAEGGYTC